MKYFLVSKTLWFNLIVILYALVTANTDALNSLHLSPEVFVALSGLANMGIRIMGTSREITFSKDRSW